MNVTQTTGVIKSFDSAKGFGFVIVDGPEPREDALLHVSALRAINASHVAVNKKIVFEVVRGAKGLSVHRIISLEGANDPVDDCPDFVPAQVKWYSATRGYGFVIEGVDGPDIFIHAEVVKASTMVDDLHTGQNVMVTIRSGAKGRRVTAIKAVGSVQPE